MEKPLMHSKDMVASNIEAIAALFPNCVTERKDANGKVTQGIDFEKLQQELTNDIFERGEERYQFTWPGKMAAIREANTPTNSALRPDVDGSEDFWNTKNLYIEGDNLEVLKLLQEDYLGKVKMIYIDPPYNTGNDFVYNDDFAESSADFSAKAGMYDEDGNMLLQNYEKNSESNGRFHTDWLNMMYPRLKVARNLLKIEGVIFISIDENEITNMRKVCNEIFGENNFVDCLHWKKKKQPSFLAKHTAKLMEYVLVYAKNKNLLEKLSIDSLSDATKKVINISNNESVRHFKAGVRVKIGDSGVLPAGRYTIKTMDVEYLSDVRYEGGVTINEVDVIAKFSVSQEKISQYIDEGLLFITANKGLRRDVSEEESNTRKSITDLLLSEYGDNQDSDNEFKELFEEKYFDYTKPVALIYNFIKSNFTPNEIVVDFFSGSATTAHAMLKLNAEDNGNRKFIMVQLPELTEENSDAYKAGYKNICEIGKERIRRAGKKIKEESPLTTQHLDTGFRVLKLADSNMKQVYYTPTDTKLQMERTLFDTADNIKKDRTDLDLLFQVMLEKDVTLDAPIRMDKILNNDVYFVDDTYLVAAFGEKLPEELIKELAKMQPFNFVMANRGLADDSMADNFEQIFKAYSPDTNCMIL